MGRSKKQKQGGSKMLSERLKEDRISQLPDSLICQILSHLRTKDSVKTSVLSTRWKTLWLWVPTLDLYSCFPGRGDFQDFDAFVTFGDKFFSSDSVSRIDKIKLRISEFAKGVDEAPYFKSWIDAAIKRQVQHLDAFCPPDIHICKVPTSLYTSETLVVLKFHEVVLPNAEFVSLPCLKTMHLKFVWYPNAATFEKLVSCCPVLEDLEISGCGIRDSVMRVQSLSLKSLKTEVHLNKCGFVIDAPLLRFLTIDDKESESYIVKNMGTNAKLDIYLTFALQDFDEASVSSRRSNIRSFLTGISKVRDMTIYTKPTEIWQGDAEVMNQTTLSYVPECLISSLKYVNIKNRISGYDAEMKLVRYFLENSVILEKLTLHLNNKNANVILKKLLKIPRRSITCQVVVP